MDSSSFGYPSIAHSHPSHYAQPYFQQVTTQSFNILQCPRVFPNFAPDRSDKDFLPQEANTEIIITKDFHPIANGMPQQPQQQETKPFLPNEDTKPFLPTEDSKPFLTNQIAVVHQPNQGQAQLSQHLQQQQIVVQQIQISHQQPNHIEANGVVVVQAQQTPSSPKKQKKKGDPNAGKYLLTKEDIEKLNSRKMSATTSVNKAKKFACDVCGRSLMTKQALDIHLRSHTGEKPYSCEECGKNFVQQATLNRHRKGVHMPKSQECFECGKMFGYRDYLVKHMRTHTGERPYSCTKCEKTFRDKTSLNQHSRSHK